MGPAVVDELTDWLAEAARRASPQPGGVAVATACCLYCGLPVLVTFCSQTQAEWDCPGCLHPQRLAG